MSKGKQRGDNDNKIRFKGVNIYDSKTGKKVSFRDGETVALTSDGFVVILQEGRINGVIGKEGDYVITIGGMFFVW